jgi:hypothetical protein
MVLKSLFRTSLVLGLYIHVYSLQRTQFLIIILQFIIIRILTVEIYSCFPNTF